MVVQERVLGEVMHELGNHLHKLYYWADYLAGGGGSTGTDASAAEMLRSSVKGLDDFLRVALEYFSPAKLDFVSVSVQELVSHLTASLNGCPVTARDAEWWQTGRLLVDPRRVMQAFQIALAQTGTAPTALTVRTVSSSGDSREEARLELEFDVSGGSATSGVRTGVGWALAEKFIDLHGGGIDYRPNENGGRSVVINLPLYS